ncbi:MAG: hypothetical protein ABIZ04_27100 [Opitutus sp.]
MTELTLYCHEADYNTSTQVCAAPYYGPVINSGWLPPLSIADAQSIAVAILMLWATAFIFRQIRKFIETS